MKRNDIWQAIEVEMRNARKKQPNWPDHIAAQAGLITEASGKLMNASLDFKYHKSASEIVYEVQQERLKEEAIKTIVQTIRFLENL